MNSIIICLSELMEIEFASFHIGFLYSHDCPNSVYIFLAIYIYMSLVMRKPAFCTCKNKDADQLRGNREADQRLCFGYIVQSLYFLNTKFQGSIAILCGCIARFVSDLVGNPEDRFSHNEAHIVLISKSLSTKVYIDSPYTCIENLS